MRWKTLIFVPLLFCLINITDTGEAGTFDSNGHIECGNENYSFASEMTFDEAKGNNDWVMFNNVYFNISSTNAIDIKLSYLNANVAAASAGDSIVTFNAETSSGKVWFNLSGFKINQSYDVFLDGVRNQGLTSSNTGVISFSHNSWSDHDVDIREGTNRLQIQYSFGAIDNIDDTSYTVIGLVATIMVVVVGVYLVGKMNLFGGNKGGGV